MNKLKMVPRSAFSVEHLYSSPSVENAWDTTRAPASHTFSNNNKTVTRTLTNVWQTGYAAAQLPSSRKSVFEVKMEGPGKQAIVGFNYDEAIVSMATGYAGQNAKQGGIYLGQTFNGQVFAGAGVTPGITYLNHNGEFSIGEICGILHDHVTGKVYLAKNGILLNAGAAIWTIPAGSKLTPCYSLYPNAKVTLRSGAGALKYNYGDFSTTSDGGITPNQGIDFFDAVNKHAYVAISNNNRVASITSDVGSYSTSYVTRVLPGNKKSVFEFIVANKDAFSACGFYFGADRTAPKTGLLGFSSPSSIGVSLGGSGIGDTYAQGCTKTVAKAGTIVEGDVLGFGWDPVAKTVVMWCNGVPMNGGAPIWTDINPLHVDGGIIPAISMRHLNARVRLNPDLPSYNYGDYTN